MVFCILRMFRRSVYLSRRSLSQRALLSSVSKCRKMLEPVSVISNNQKRTISTTRAVMLPPHELVMLPALSPTMETGTIKQWEVRNKHSMHFVRKNPYVLQR